MPNALKFDAYQNSVPNSVKNFFFPNFTFWEKINQDYSSKRVKVQTKYFNAREFYFGDFLRNFARTLQIFLKKRSGNTGSVSSFPLLHHPRHPRQFESVCPSGQAMISSYLRAQLSPLPPPLPLPLPRPRLLLLRLLPLATTTDTITTRRRIPTRGFLIEHTDTTGGGGENLATFLLLRHVFQAHLTSPRWLHLDSSKMGWKEEKGDLNKRLFGFSNNILDDLPQRSCVLLATTGGRSCARRSRPRRWRTCPRGRPTSGWT